MNVISTLLALLTAFSTALVFVGGACFAYGFLPAAYVMAAIGAGWLGIVYSSLLRWVSSTVHSQESGPGMDQPGSVMVAPDTPISSNPSMKS